MDIRIDRVATNQWVIFDGDALSKVDPLWFERAFWEAEGQLTSASRGRGSAWAIRSTRGEWMLRHYMRGGFAARLNRDKYFWSGFERSRSFREWRLLAHMHDLGLPSPRPLAARTVRSGLVYRSDLLMELIPDATMFSQWLSQWSGDDESQWARVGECVALFHAHNIYHADLNTHNLLITSDGVSMIDFDRGAVMAGGGVWRERNMRRLKRSINKVTGCDCDTDLAGGWKQLLDAYHARLSQAS